MFMTALLAALLSYAEPMPPAQHSDLQAAAKTFLDQVAKGDFDNAVKTFDATMTKVMPAEKLKSTWQMIAVQAGAYQKQLGVRAEPRGKYVAIVITCQFEKGKFDVHVVYDTDKHIAGLNVLPAAEYKPPSYVKKDAFREEEVKVGSGEWVLPGTLTLPVGTGPFPAVVLVHGSGPQDRDESIGPNKTFRDIAWGLASRGIAVLRYEKRTKEYQTKLIAMKDQDFTAKDEVDDDALAAVELLRKTKEIDGMKIFILGHSLGGTMAPRIGARDPGIAGLIILAGTTRALEDVTLEQLDYIASLEGTGDLQRAEIEKLRKQVARLKDPQTSANDFIMGAKASYWRELRDYHPADVAAELKQPMLILQGERDYQVTMVDFAGWKKSLAVRKNVTFKSYPNLNHTFVEGAGKATPVEYLKPGHVAETVIADIAEWVKRN
jgi:dienelactone hydrolase